MASRCLCLPKPQNYIDVCGGHAQEDDEDCAFWTRVLARALVRIAGTSEPLLPWLADEIDQQGISNQAEFGLTDAAPVCLVWLLSGPSQLDGAE